MHQSSKCCEGDDLRYKPSQAPADLNSKVFGADYDGDIALVIVNRALAPPATPPAKQAVLQGWAAANRYVDDIDVSGSHTLPRRERAASSSGQ